MRTETTLLLLATAAWGVVGCGPSETPTTNVGCWVDQVLDFSTEGSATDYAASQVLGAADTQDWDSTNAGCIDSPLAWSPAAQDTGEEHLTIQFAGPISVDRVLIYDNFGPGVIYMVTLTNTQDAGVPVLQFAVPGENQGPGQPCGAPLAVDTDESDGFEYLRDTYDHVNIQMNTTYVSGWNEIDAVMLAGQVRGKGLGNAPAGCFEFTPAAPTPTPSPSPTPTP